jgi:hypothetical protein
MAITEVVLSPAGKFAQLFPVSGAGSNIPRGTLLMRGATGGTNKSVLIPCTASSNAHAVGLLAELHNFSLSGDALTATLNSWYPNGTLASGKTAFPSHSVELLDTAVVMRVEYFLTSTVAVASYSNGTITITSFEADYDGGFVYANAGTGIGQLGFVASSSSGSCVLTAALTTALDNTTKLTKIMPLFLDTPIWKVNSTTVPTLIDSSAAAGTGRAVNLGNFISKGDGISQYLDPLTYHNAQSLNSISNLVMHSNLALVDSVFHPVA